MPFPDAHPGLLAALAARGYSEPTPVQAAVLEAKAEGRDLLVSAQTGSGKTVAFGLAIAPTLMTDGAARFAVEDPRPRGLVVAPTRELALQVQRELTWLYAQTGARIIACVGGMDIRREAWLLTQGAAIVVGTPGRLRDHLERGQLGLGAISVVVLDEADEMLDLGFREELEALLEATPSSRRTLMFSATLPRHVVALAKRYTKEALRLSTVDEESPHGDIDYQAMAIHPRERDLAVVNVLRASDTGALVFCATRDGVTHLANNLAERGFSVVPMSGELSQAERTRALQALRDGRARACVATDVAARGLDLPDLGIVIHADLPQNGQVLLHRSGRTGRAGKKGTAVVLVPAPARHHAARLFASAGINARWVPPPSADAIRAVDQMRLGNELATSVADATDEEKVTAAALIASQGAETLALALVRMHRARLPAPEELTVVTDRNDRPRQPGFYGPRLGDKPRAGEVSTPPPEGSDLPMQWFRIDIGRMSKADPKWLIPVICTRGGITKAEIGAIRVGPAETRFQIAGHVADRFDIAAARAPKDHQDRTVRTAKITRSTEPPHSARPRSVRKPS
jgi:ATP-dependent RNA helicase DeaD